MDTINLNTLLKKHYPNVLTKDEKVISIEHLSTDTRERNNNTLLFLIEGESFDPHQHLDKLDRVSFIIAQKEIDVNIPHIVDPDLKDKLTSIYSTFFGYPQNKMTHIGITGTNGKTSVGIILQNIFKEVCTASYIGTLGVQVNEEEIELPFDTPTTPQNSDLITTFSHLRGYGVKVNALEVSSHGLDQERVKGVPFKYGVFTNLTSDHLDYHGTMEHYLESKKRLFDGLYKEAYAVVNSDDKATTQVVADTRAQVFTFGIDKDADLKALNITPGASNTTFDVLYQGKLYPFSTHLIGKFNIYNLLSALSVALLEGLEMEFLQEAVSEFNGIPGRLERVPNKDYHVFVDYAHTPDGLLNVIETLNDIKGKSRLITVFGCGGDRDKTKRPAMGEIATRLSDAVIITSDNPRTENPHSIISDIYLGADRKNKDKVSITADRKEAIMVAIDQAYKGDIILIAGKGHEDYQIVNNEELRFDDRLVARELLDR